MVRQERGANNRIIGKKERLRVSGLAHTKTNSIFVEGEVSGWNTVRVKITIKAK